MKRNFEGEITHSSDGDEPILTESDGNSLSQEILETVTEWCRRATECGNHSPICLAIMVGDLNGARTLLKYRDHPEVTRNENVKKVLPWLRDMNKKDKNQLTPLQVALLGDHDEAVSVLVDQKANLEGSMDEDGWTLLQHVIARDNVKMISTLVSLGVDITGTGNKRFTPLQYAAQFRRKDIVSRLIAQKANLEMNDFGYTPLHISAALGDGEIVRCLLKSRANIEAKHWNQYTPLHHAAESGNIEVVSCLIRNRANIEAKDQRQNTPLNVSPNEEIKKLLQAWNSSSGVKEER